MKDMLSRKEFEGVLSAVNDATASAGAKARYAVGVSDDCASDGWIDLRLLAVTAGGTKRTVCSKFCSRLSENREYDALLSWAVEELHWPDASSREEAEMKIAAAGSARKIAARLLMTLATDLIREAWETGRKGR